MVKEGGRDGMKKDVRRGEGEGRRRSKNQE